VAKPRFQECPGANFAFLESSNLHNFADSTKKWQILKDNITEWTLKSLSATLVESYRKCKSCQIDIREVLLKVSDIDNEVKTSSEAKGLENNKLVGEYSGNSHFV
jgi:hypothetical protein